jgi:hypothetical protein
LLYGASKKGNLKMKLKLELKWILSALGPIWIVGLLFGCASHSAQNPKSIASPGVEQTQAGAPMAISQTDNIRVEVLDSPSIPIDLAGRPDFSTQGFVIAREKYTNLNDHSIKLLPSQIESTLVLQSQVHSFAANLPGSSSSTTMPVAVSVTAPKNAFDIERVSNSLSGSDIELPAGDEVTLSWRISPAPGLPLCPYHLGTMIFNHTGSTTTSAEGSSISGTFTRKVSFNDDTNLAQGELFSGPIADSSSGTVNTTPNGYGSTGNCAWVDYINSSPDTYNINLSSDFI